MHNNKEQAFVLRKRGLSYNFISRKLDIPISTLSGWFSGIPWSEAIKKNLAQKAFIKVYPQLLAMTKARILKWQKWREDARLEARKDFENLSKAPLFLAGIMIYWGEGDKNPKNPVRISNIDPAMLKIFVKFLKNICKLQSYRIKAHLTLYPDLNELVCKEYWVPRIGIKQGLFNKTQFIKGRYKTKRLNYGICSIEVLSSTQLKEKLLTWIECFAKHL